MTLKPIDCYEIYNNPDLYDSESNHTTDIPFYTGLVHQTGSPVLELACGTGRVSIPLARAGFDVTGLDISAPFIQRAKEKAEKEKVNAVFDVADCRTFDLDKKFNLIIMPFNAIAHIHDRKSYEGLFNSVRKHLNPDGRFSFAWFNPNEKYLYRDPNKRYPSLNYTLPDGTPVIVTENNIYDKATQINYIKWYYKIGDKEEFVRELNMRILYPAELDMLLYYNGFDLEVKYGDYEKSPFQSSSVHQVCVFKLRD